MNTIRKAAQQADIAATIRLLKTLETFEESGFILKKIKIAELQAFDMAEHLQTDEVVAAYLTLLRKKEGSSWLVHAPSKNHPRAWFE